MTLYIKNYSIRESFFNVLRLTQQKVESIIGVRWQQLQSAISIQLLKHKIEGGRKINLDGLVKSRHSGEPRIEVRGRNRTESRPFVTA